MSNGARHGLGVVAGLVLAPIVAASLMYGTNKLRMVMTFGYARFRSYHGEELWIGAGLILLAAVLLGLLTGSRLSPVASLIPGAAFTLVGLIWFASPSWAVQHAGRDVMTRDMYLGYTALGSMGILFLLGVLLLVASLAPSRWKARAAAGAAPRFAGPPPAPMGPPPMPGGPAPMGVAPMGAAPMGAPQPPPSQSPSWQGAPQPQFGAPPAQPAASNPPPLPPAPPTPPAQEKKQEPSIEGGSDDDEPGEWTRMYGGNRPK
ncbi:hypothetical protein [Actinomadura bangladeshensis]|uniref:hypothetical protein n=1 Tax=Actinomadura bangladeshensis TaxID=453573 RepID=UPI0031DFB7B7